MEKEVIIPENVEVEVDEKHARVSGPKGELRKEFKHFFDIKVKKEGNKIKVSSSSERRRAKAMVGTIAAHLRNMIKGVTQGYTYKMRIVYTHFPITIKVEGDKILINNFMGENIPRVAKIVGDTKIEVKGQDITLTGVSREDVGQTAANIEQACRISKYDRRVFQDGIYITEKGR